MSQSRQGLLAGGNFIVDTVKIIDHYPAENMLATILRESTANGGGPYNILKDLAAMGAGFPLEAVGVTGGDANGAWILEDCRAHGIDTTQLHRLEDAPTSYTDAMTVESTGRRTFFHQRGANARLDTEHFDFSKSNARLFHLAYLMLLDRLDSFTEDGSRTRASLVLESAKKAGMVTSLDIVSTENPKFREIALSSLPFTDHLVINEVEAGKILGTKLSAGDLPGLENAALELLKAGVGQSVVLHFEEGAVAVEKGGAPVRQGSLVLPAGYSQGATGAGDAFAAGYLYGLHEGWSLAERLKLAVCAAAACLSDPTPSGGLRPVAECLELANRWPFRE